MRHLEEEVKILKIQCANLVAFSQILVNRIVEIEEKLGKTKAETAPYDYTFKSIPDLIKEIEEGF